MMTCQGAAEQLGAVGIDLTINYLSNDQMLLKVEQRRDSDFFLEPWNMDPDSEGLLRDLFYSTNRYNLARYANARIDELIDKIRTEMVTISSVALQSTVAICKVSSSSVA
jgi:ABC-type transport system substrate-binding protein